MMTEEMENECKMKEEWIYDGRNSNLKKLPSLLQVRVTFW